MSDLLAIGASGVRAYQSALDVVGQNIANTGTAGYTRRTTDLREVTAGVGVVANGAGAGSGVIARGVNRAADTYATAAVRTAGADLAKTETAATWLDRIGKTLSLNDVSTRITAFFNAASALSAEPASSALRATMLGQAGNVANAFAATGQGFDQIDADMDAAGRLQAQSLTALGQALVKVNDGLGRTAANTSASAQLLDQRDQILDQMSAITDLKATTDSIGRVSVSIGAGTGVAFVGIDRAGTIAYRRTGDGEVGFVASVAEGWAALSPTGGSMAGTIDAAQRVGIARSGLESIAADFAAQVNTVQTGGEDLDGNPTTGKPLFAVGARATDLSVALTDGAEIAAASVGGGTRDASNLARLQSIRATRGFEGQSTALVTDNAAQLKQRTTIADAQTAIRAGAETALLTATGVNLDSEAIELMRFQQAYQASSRVIQIARDTLNSILEIR